jgi:hypothetical protein
MNAREPETSSPLSKANRGHPPNSSPQQIAKLHRLKGHPVCFNHGTMDRKTKPLIHGYGIKTRVYGEGSLMTRCHRIRLGEFPELTGNTLTLKLSRNE